MKISYYNQYYAFKEVLSGFRDLRAECCFFIYFVLILVKFRSIQKEAPSHSVMNEYGFPPGGSILAKIMTTSVRSFITIAIFLTIICMPPALLAMADDLTIVATDEAFQEAKGWMDFLKAKEIPIVHITPNEFAKGSKAKYIVLMGGMDEPYGIRDIAQKVLSKEEFQSISKDANGKAFKKYLMPKNAKGPRLWDATVNYIIFAGTDLAAAVKARKNSKDMWWKELAVWFDIDESPAMHPY